MSSRSPAGKECSIAPTEIDAPSSDPRSADYAEGVLRTWRAITGRETYDARTNETFPLDSAEFLARPYPYSSSDPVEVSRYLGAVAAVVERIGGAPPRRIIEYGTGWGHLALTLAATGYEVTAVDLNPASVDLLRRRSRALGVALDVVECGFLEHRTERPVDTIVFLESFHHCERPFELLDQCTGQLTDGGRLLFLAEAIHDDFYLPWGVRLDGAAAFMAAQHGWLELGFRRQFFEAELAARGFTSTWDVLGWLGAVRDRAGRRPGERVAALRTRLDRTRGRSHASRGGASMASTASERAARARRRSPVVPAPIVAPASCGRRVGNGVPRDCLRRNPPASSPPSGSSRSRPPGRSRAAYSADAAGGRFHPRRCSTGNVAHGRSKRAEGPFTRSVGLRRFLRITQGAEH